MTTTYAYVPKTTNFNNKGIQWYNDNQLIKREGGQVMQTIKIKKLQNEIEMLVWNSGVEKFRITESFPKGGIKEMVVDGLRVDIEDGIATFYDENDNILKNEYVIMGFVIDNVKIYKFADTIFGLIFPDGITIIQGVLEISSRGI